MPKVKRIFKNIHKRSDAKGNMLLVDEEPVYGNRKVFIHLHGETHPRLIGEIDRRNRIMFVKRDRNKHFHFAMNAFGFNYVVIKEAKQFSKVLLQIRDGDSMTYYMIPTQVFITSGVVKSFVVQGFEIQVFLRMEYIETFRTSNKFVKGALV